ncbi:30S ribosomal protein S27ae [Candidatus Woesearchaeota archaeon CG10_big_fil_rev_8_21_14_0_10_37_12]|nr:MAG: 30S ribosomal protein S27ae [Candidatus Woesearchaeota archaeon CG10_big_fil_rev_8_21_14_0_10_37_12]
MAKKGGAKESKKREKKVRKRKPTYKLYEIQGEKVVRKAGWSPKLGAGYFLAEHKDRKTCGKTGYTEFKKKEDKK